MEIKIDTTKDSREDIKKAIKLLRSLISEDYEETEEQKEYSDPEPGTFNLFGDAPTGNDGEDDKKDDEEPEKQPRVEVVEY